MRNTSGLITRRSSLGLSKFLERRPDTNVDVVPINPADLTALRIGVGLTRKRLAVLAGCSRPMISLIEKGTRKPGRALLQRVLEALAAVFRSATVTDFSWWVRWRDVQSLCEVRWARIKSVSPINYTHPYVYDLSVPGPETFLSGRGWCVCPQYVLHRSGNPARATPNHGAGAQ